MKRNYKLYAMIWGVLFLICVIGLVASDSAFWTVAVIVLGVIAVACAAAYMANYMKHVDTSSDFRIKAQTSFVRLTTADAEGYVKKAQDEEIRENCRKVYEALRYSDPMSTDNLGDIEQQITNRMFALGEAVNRNSVDEVKEVATEIINLVGDRERICKAIK